MRGESASGMETSAVPGSKAGRNPQRQQSPSPQPPSVVQTLTSGFMNSILCYKEMNQAPWRKERRVLRTEDVRPSKWQSESMTCKTNVRQRGKSVGGR